MAVNITEVMWMLGRVLLGAYYAWAGIHHFTGFALIGGLLIAAAYVTTFWPIFTDRMTAGFAAILPSRMPIRDATS